MMLRGLVCLAVGVAAACFYACFHAVFGDVKRWLFSRNVITATNRREAKAADLGDFQGVHLQLGLNAATSHVLVHSTNTKNLTNQNCQERKRHEKEKNHYEQK